MSNATQQIADELGLTVDEVEEVGIEDLIDEDTGSSGETTYSYYFNVPENTPKHILDKKAWSVGDRVELSLNTFDEPDDHA
ncbi:hypothetical protein HW452_05195 [Halomonas aquamarina]|uniref:Uncharacterized protein n=1 Tax=Vreelandella aquamarina TaxID=77097 RepID=A0ACC5VS69_9GAMM|nr:hypothetical protein [Halomonas aquamarina]MBZ5486917.1 hypothetical protein [Halomonas aquamarina]